MNKLFVMLGVLMIMIACNKQNIENQDGVWIRIENKSTVTMTSIKIGDTIYNDLPKNTTSAYKLIEFPIYAAYCNFKVNGKDAWTGYGICGTPMPPPFEPGYYTFKIGSTATSDFYSIEVEKR